MHKTVNIFFLLSSSRVICLEKHDKTKVHLSGRKKIALVTLILVILASLEVYAHTYVQVHSLSVVSRDEAIHSFPFGQSTGTYLFSSTGCQWLVVWKAEVPSPSMNYGFISIHKLEQNKSLFTLNIGVVVLKLQPTSNNTGAFWAELDEVLYENNSTSARIRYYFSGVGTYKIEFGLVARVYEETLLATFLREETRIPLETTIYYGPL
jgi:hypothetical protein